MKMYTLYDLIQDLKDWKRRHGDWITTSELIRYVIFKRKNVSFWSVLYQFRKAVKLSIVIAKIDRSKWIYKYYITNNVFRYDRLTGGYTYSNTYNKYILNYIIEGRDKGGK